MLADAHGRTIGDLRVSVTDRCNFRCRYCMPAEGMPWIPREEILSFEEIERLVALFAAMGVTDLRLTGREAVPRRAPPGRRAAGAARLSRPRCPPGRDCRDRRSFADHERLPARWSG